MAGVGRSYQQPGKKRAGAGTAGAPEGQRPREGAGKGRGFFGVLIMALLGFGLVSVLAFLFLLGLFVAGGQGLKSGNIAVIPVKGVILSADQSGSFLGESIAASSEIIELIDEAESNPRIVGIVFEINSPGGSPVASDEIGQRIKVLNKTSVAWIREMGASGGYWVASSCDFIVANRMSAVGSIGVTASYLGFSGLLDDYNVSYNRLVSGSVKDIGSPWKDLEPHEEKLLQDYIDELYSIFIDEIAGNRGLERPFVEGLATGMIFLGKDALEMGLVDRLGGKVEALRIIEEENNVTARPVSYEREKTFFDLLVGAMKENSFYIGRGVSYGFLKDDRPGQSNLEITF